MSMLSVNSLEEVLQLCAAQAPSPWYPRDLAMTPGTDFQALGDLLEQLWLEGLIQKAEQSPQRGPGFTLTPLGDKVLADPLLLQRLRDGEPLEDTLGSRIRHALRISPRPVASIGLLILNFLVFGYGALLAWQKGGSALKVFLSGGLLGGQDQTLLTVLHQTGSVQGLDILRGEWWRLLTSAFCHLGFLHIGMNMYMLWAAGTAIEQRWGSWRYLIIYLMGAWGGGCLAMALQPATTYVGASGALCGVLGAELVWVLLTDRYLPRSIVRQARSQIFATIVILVVISFIPGVSGWGHLGGAIGGILAALILHFQRFGSTPVRWLGWIALLPLPYLGWLTLEQAQNGIGWQKVAKYAREYKEREEREAFEKDYLSAIRKTTRTALTSFREKIEPVVDRHPNRRTPEEVANALAELPILQEGLHILAKRLTEAGPYRTEEVETARVVGLEYTQAVTDLLTASEKSLREKSPWKGDATNNVLQAEKKWNKLLE